MDAFGFIVRPYRGIVCIFPLNIFVVLFCKKIFVSDSGCSGLPYLDYLTLKTNIDVDTKMNFVSILFAEIRIDVSAILKNGCHSQHMPNMVGVPS